MNNSADRSIVIVGLALLSVLLCGAAVFINVGTYDIAIGGLMAVVIVVASMPIFRSLGQIDADSKLPRVLATALCSKLIFSLARYWMVMKLYGGVGDSTSYVNDGWMFAKQVRSGSLVPSIESIDNLVTGTRQITKLTGYLMAITGPSKFAGFFFFSWLAFWGCVLFARGARRAFPQLDHKKYLYLVLFWPSLMFWPSSVGKDAVMVFFLGVVTYGACVLLAPKAKVWGVAPFAVGVFGLLQVRVHVALMAVLAVTVATTFAFIGGEHVEKAAKRGRVVRLVGLVVMVLFASTAATQTTRFFSDEAGQSTSTKEALELTVKRTQQGGSSFQPIVVTNPLQIPAATVSVLFRPFPWEAHSAGTLVSAAEGSALALLFVLSWKRLRRWPGSAWRRAILLYGFVYSLMFVVAFSSIGNAGILARQRSQMLPLLFLALAVPTDRWWQRRPDDELASESDDGPVDLTKSQANTDWANAETLVSR